MNTRVFLTSVLLLFIPAIFWLSSWRWQGEEFPLAYPLYLITQSGGKPWVILTTLVLFILLYYAHRRSEICALLLLVSVSLCVTQIGKNLLKIAFAQPRPYVVVLTGNSPARIRDFYAVPRAARSEAVSAYYQKAQNGTPPYLVAHRAYETGYSFPSGHSINAASWSLLFAGIIGFASRRRCLISGGVILWAALVMASRVWLGMHYPVDLAVAVILAFAINLPLLRLWQQRRNAPPLPQLFRRFAAWHK